MDAIARRAEVVEQLAFFLECRLRRSEECELEHRVRTDALAQLACHIAVRSADMPNLKVAQAVHASQRVDTRGPARNSTIDAFEAKPVRAQQPHLSRHHVCP